MIPKSITKEHILIAMQTIDKEGVPKERNSTHYYVKHNGRFEVRELIHECDPNKTTQENLNDAYEKALKMGLVNDKQIRWKMIR